MGEAIRSDRISFWLDSTCAPDRPVLRGDRTADVVVVGAGITGLMTALLLAQAGRLVTVIEADMIAAGVSGFTTAKVTVGHGLIYSRLESKFDAATARAYADSQSAGLGLIGRLCGEHAIDCDLEARANYVVATSDEAHLIEIEAAAARGAGLDATVTSAGNPITPGIAVMLSDQAQFHVRRFLLRLADLVVELGGQIFEHSRVTDISGGFAPYSVRTEHGSIRAADVVVATHYPIVEQGFFATRIHPHRSYVVAAPLEEAAPDGMFITASAPSRSLRTAPLPDGRQLLLVGGEGHRVGQEPDTPGRYASLEADMRKHFSVGATMYRWSTQDNFPVDGLPYIGSVGEHPGLHVATGFAGWGMTNGALAAILISDAIAGTANPWAELYALERRHVMASAKSFVVDNTNVAMQQISDALRSAPDARREIRAGEGVIASIEGKQVAISRDAEGRLHSVSPNCTHMGCVVRWNAAEGTWDCPCHGSRFAPDGRVLHGPAVSPLSAAPVDQAQFTGGRR